MPILSNWFSKSLIAQFHQLPRLTLILEHKEDEESIVEECNLVGNPPEPLV